MEQSGVTNTSERSIEVDWVQSKSAIMKETETKYHVIVDEVLRGTFGRKEDAMAWLAAWHRDTGTSGKTTTVVSEKVDNAKH